MRVALVGGHRSRAEGAVTPNGISEFDMWYVYLRAIKDFLPDQHEYKIFERKDDDGRYYSQRIRRLTERINAWGADIAFSFHFNAAENKKAQGFEILTTKYWLSREYARMFLDILDAEMPNDNRGNKILKTPHDDGYLFVKLTAMPTMIIEPFFGSSKKDTKQFFKNMGNFTNGFITLLNKI